MCQQKFSQNRAHVEALDVMTTVTDRRKGLGAARPCEALGGLGRPEISRDVPAKILTEQGAAALLEALRPLRMAQLRGLRNGLGELQGFGRVWEALGGPAMQRLGGCQRSELLMLSAFWLQRGTSGPPAPRRVLQQGPRGVPAKTLGFRVSTLLRGRASSGRHGGGSRPALPGLHDVFCRSRSSGSFGLRVAVVEPSAKTLGFKV